jgi:hypothetical protein
MSERPSRNPSAGALALVVGALPIACSALSIACSEEQPTMATLYDAASEGSAAAGGSGGSGGVAGDSGSDVPDGAAGSAGCLNFEMPSDCTIPEGAVLPGELRCTGLYGDWQTRELACGVIEFEPAFELWSDAAEKRRWVSLPAGETIDVSDPDGFVFPVGTQFWKEFRVPDTGDFRLGETRLLRKTDAGWLYTSYVWSEDAQSTVQTNEGVADLHGTGHSVPTRDQCRDCHGGRSDFVLGWDFLLLGPGASGLTREELSRLGLLARAGSTAPTPTEEIPGDATERAALGYLHVNCGVSCHNETPEARAKPSGLYLRLEASDLISVQATDAVTTGINRLPNPNAELGGLPTPQSGPYYDFRPLDVARSLSVVRMDVRGAASQMPRIGTNRIDESGVNIVSAWINGMTPERGYPEALP